MTKPYTEFDLSNIFDEDLIWRRKELSDIKASIRAADRPSMRPLLRALVAMSYAHWEGYVRTCATRYFEYLVLRRKSYSTYEQQIYINSFLNRLEALHHGKCSLEDRCRIISDILNSRNRRFAWINQKLLDTHSNLNTDKIKEFCLICGVDSKVFENYRIFIDILLLKRRNAIAHGQQEYIELDEIDEIIEKVLSLMGIFRNLLENKIYTKSFAA
jgi:hypothetical protein